MDKLPGTLRGKTTTNLPIQHSYPVNLDLATDQYVGFLRVSATAAHLDCEFLSTSQTLPIDSFRL